MATIARQHGVELSGPNSENVFELSTTGERGASLPDLVKDVFLCMKTLIKVE